MKNNIHKKATYENKFSRRYACWVKNNRKAWRFWKVRNRRLFRKMLTIPKVNFDKFLP